jgi:hypothetical protein
MLDLWGNGRLPQQPQLPSTRHSFGAPLHVKLAKDAAIVPFNRIQSEEELLANLTI